MLRETVEIVKAMWTEPDVDLRRASTSSSRARSATRSRCSSPHPPILIGGGGEQLTLRVVARHADALELRRQAPRVGRTRPRCCKGHCKDVGRDYDEIQQDVVARGVHPRDRGRGRRRPARGRSGASRSESWTAGNLVGTPEQVAEKIQTYVDLGCTGFYPWCSDYPDTETMRLFAEKVIPQLPLTCRPRVRAHARRRHPAHGRRAPEGVGAHQRHHEDGRVQPRGVRGRVARRGHRPRRRARSTAAT